MDLLAGDRVETMRTRTRDIRATEYSPDGLITAVVGGRGDLLELELDPRVLREQNASALAQSIMDTVRSAADAAGRESVRIVEGLLRGDDGGDDGAGDGGDDGASP